MKINQKEYANWVKKASPPSKKIKNTICAFLFGGVLCAFAQGMLCLDNSTGMPDKTAKLLVPVTLIVLTALFTGLKLFDKFSKVAGAGALVPITGFANSVVSPAIEFKHEGFVLGLGTNIFKIAGPVIVYGLSAGFIYGVILWIFSL